MQPPEAMHKEVATDPRSTLCWDIAGPITDRIIRGASDQARAVEATVTLNNTHLVDTCLFSL